MITDKHINTIGLGCVTFGREIDQSVSFGILDYAFTNDINLFDTASAYGNGASEIILGRWMSSRRPIEGSVTVATKILPPYNPQNIYKSVDESLKRLGTDILDILYLHRWDESFENAASIITLNNLLRDGKVRKLGVSNFTAQQLQRALELQQEQDSESFRYVQNNHNLAVSDITNHFRKICMEHEIEIITYSPLGAGFLTGKHQHGVIAGSRFDLLPAHQDIYFNDIAKLRLAKLQEVAVRLGVTPSHLALAWSLHQPGVSKVLIGVRNLNHIRQAIAAEDFYDPEIFSELEC